MGGSSSSTGTQTQKTKQQSETQPWEPTIAGLGQVIQGVNSLTPDYKATADETAALGQIKQNAQAGNPYQPKIAGLADDLLSGGPDRSGYLTDAYFNYQQQAQPYLSQSYLDPSTNPHFQNYMQTTSNDIQNRVNGMFAGAGRDMSGANLQTLARGITEGTAPIFANQYNQNVATQRGMMDNLYNAGGQTGQALAGMDQGQFQNRTAGVHAADQALQSQNYGANAMLQAEALRRGLPLGNLGNIANLLLPIAGLGQKSEGSGTMTGTTNTQNQMSGAQQFGLIAGGLGNLSAATSPTSGFGRLLWGRG